MFFNNIKKLINKNHWNMIIILTLVYRSLYKILKECLGNVVLKVNFVSINYKKLKFGVALLQACVFTVTLKYKNKLNKYNVSA